LNGELARRGWQESDLAARLRSDPGKLAIAARLRSETTLPIKWIAALALPSHREQSNVGLCAYFMAELGVLSYMQ